MKLRSRQLSSPTLPERSSTTTSSSSSISPPSRKIGPSSVETPKTTKKTINKDNHDRKFKCAILNCSLSFKYIRDYHRHVVAKHSTFKHFKCSLCSHLKEYNRRDNLLRHLRTIHKLDQVQLKEAMMNVPLESQVRIPLPIPPITTTSNNSSTIKKTDAGDNDEADRETPTSSTSNNQTEAKKIYLPYVTSPKSDNGNLEENFLLNDFNISSYNYLYDYFMKNEKLKENYYPFTRTQTPDIPQKTEDPLKQLPVGLVLIQEESSNEST